MGRAACGTGAVAALSQSVDGVDSPLGSLPARDLCHAVSSGHAMSAVSCEKRFFSKSVLDNDILD